MLKYQLKGEIDSKATKAFTKFINEYEIKDLHIIIDSLGGDNSEIQNFIFLINSLEDNVTLIASSMIGSAAFEIFVLAECKKRILPFTGAMYHGLKSQIFFDHNGNPCDEHEKYKFELLVSSKEITKNVCELSNMNDEEINLIMQGKDVYFTWDRLKEMFPEYTS